MVHVNRVGSEKGLLIAKLSKGSPKKLLREAKSLVWDQLGDKVVEEPKGRVPTLPVARQSTSFTILRNVHEFLRGMRISITGDNNISSKVTSLTSMVTTTFM